MSVSKAEQTRAKLSAMISKDKVQYAQQKLELEAEMKTRKENMGKINRGLRNKEIIESPIHINQTTDTSSLLSENFISPNLNSKYTSHSSTKDKSSRNRITKNENGSPNFISAGMPGVNASANSSEFADAARAAMMQPVMMPSGTRVSDWCYNGALDSSPPIVKANTVYESVRILGRGSFGEVLLFKNIEDNKLFAIKTILTERESDMKEVLREVRSLRTLRHPCIIDIHDGFITDKPRVLNIVMQYCEAGDLGIVISNARKHQFNVPEAKLINWSLQIALALHFLHENKTLHRDLKPCNVMLVDGGELVKIVDFGLAVELVDDVCESATEAGTPLYTAPEMIQGERYSYPTDCWSFGVMLHELMSLSLPFTGSSTWDLVRSILTDTPPPLPSYYSEELRTVCMSFLVKNPSDRLGFAGMLLEPIFHSKTMSFPQCYRPRSLEERLKRCHAKQLSAQVEYLPLSTRSSLSQPILSFIAQMGAPPPNNQPGGVGVGVEGATVLSERGGSTSAPNGTDMLAAGNEEKITGEGGSSRGGGGGGPGQHPQLNHKRSQVFRDREKEKEVELFADPLDGSQLLAGIERATGGRSLDLADTNSKINMMPIQTEMETETETETEGVLPLSLPMDDSESMGMGMGFDLISPNRVRDKLVLAQHIDLFLNPGQGDGGGEGGEREGEVGRVEGK